MRKDGFLRFCDDPEIACCKAERELEQLRAESASLREQLDEGQRRERAAVELIADVEEMINSGAEWFDSGACEWGEAMERYRGEPGDEHRFEMSMHIRDAYRIGIDRSNLDDSAFIAASRALVPQLCEALEAAEKELIDCHHTQKVADGKTAENARLRRINEQLTARAEKAEAENRWIPVSERLPDHVDSYLVYYHEWSNGDFLPEYDDYKIRVMRFLNNRKWCMPVCVDKQCEADTNQEVTHWRPLPDPPEGE